MDRIKSLVGQQKYGRIEGDEQEDYSEAETLHNHEEVDEDGEAMAGARHSEALAESFEWFIYGVFFLLGIAMLWAWNMFLAAGPYFQSRFQSSDWILRNFQSAELSVSTIANLGVAFLLTNLQANASYSRRIIYALVVNIITFTLLAMSTRLFTGVSAPVYFVFLMILVASASLATGTLQNGIFAYVSGFGQEAYTQGIMTGQAVAGVSPPLVQILSVLSAASAKTDAGVPEQSSGAAMAYFLTATGVSTVALIAFLYLYRSRRAILRSKAILEEVDRHDDNDLGTNARTRVPLTVLFRKTFWLASSVFICFAATMVYPVYTQQIESVNRSGALSNPAAYIPLAFFFWNAGDLIGRLLTALPALRITHRAKLVFLLSVSRMAFIPLYLLCNVHGRGAKVNSDFFYLVIVQLLFGISNGYVGSTCMMGAAEYVDEHEREAAGGFMGLALVGGLTVGSLLSFLVPG